MYKELFFLTPNSPSSDTTTILLLLLSITLYFFFLFTLSFVNILIDLYFIFYSTPFSFFSPS
jgi:hypothetical protein